MHLIRSYLVLAVIVLMMQSFKADAQRIAILEVKLQQEQSYLEIPVHVNLDAITLLHDSILQLVEVKGTNRVEVSYQIDDANERNLHWIIEPDLNKNKSRVYELIRKKPQQYPSHIDVAASDGFVTITNNNRSLLRYNYNTVYPPKGVDTAFRRSAFIHPLWSPRGQELTQVNPPDHYHHFGLWNPWTHVLFEKDTVDFWNLGGKQGTVRFANFLSTTVGNVFAGYSALHEHVVFKKGGEQKVAINEVQSVRIYQPTDKNYYIADISIELNCATASAVLLLEYRYGGLGLRATKEWDNSNSEIATSEGKARKEADGSRARWCMVQGALNNDHAGLVMMSHPTNYNYPEPLRVWPEDMNKRGDVFLNFSPTKNINWLLTPGKKYLLKYRLLVFNDQFSNSNAEIGWKNFAYSPSISVKINKEQVQAEKKLNYEKIN